MSKKCIVCHRYCRRLAMYDVRGDMDYNGVCYDCVADFKAVGKKNYDRIWTVDWKGDAALAVITRDDRGKVSNWRTITIDADTKEEAYEKVRANLIIYRKTDLE